MQPKKTMMSPISVFKLLSDDTRLRSILLLHSEGELCVCELIEALGEPQTKISRHLSLLRSAGLVFDRRQGQWVYYRIADALPAWIHDLLRVSAEAYENRLASDIKRLVLMTDEPRLATVK